jgi:hypothetical protein
MLKGLFSPHRDKVTGGLKRLHEEELNNLYLSRTIVRRSDREERVGWDM